MGMDKMGQETWNTIKGSKFFYVRTYRMAGKLLVISLIINLLLILLIYYLFYNRAERDYYASSGVTPPVLLKALAEPNKSSQYLLAPVPTKNETEKVIPQ
jgi:intracellular multiplication protein IcmM